MEVAGKVADVLVGAPINNEYLLNNILSVPDVEEDTTENIRRSNET